MSTEMKKQCSNCLGWYTNLKGFKHHLRHCKKSNDSETSEEVQRNLSNPMLSIGFESNTSGCLEDQSIHHADMFETSADYSDIGEMKDNYDDMFHDVVDSSFLPLHRKTMAVTKFEVMLNDLLLKHKASLLLYDEIIALVSTYISSPNFNRFDKIKSRKSLLRSTQKSLNTNGLRPLNGTVHYTTTHF